MKKLFVLLLLPLLLLTACSNKESSKLLRCSYEGKEGDYSTIEWTKEQTIVVTTISYDNEEIAEQNEEIFKNDKTVTNIQRDGKIILLTRATKNKKSKSIDSVKSSYEKEGYKCNIEDAEK